MTTQDDAIVELVGVLESRRLPYMIIGGIANAVWGRPRATLDIDVTVWVEAERMNAAIDDLVGVLACRTDAPHDFVAKTRVLPLRSAAGVGIDLVFGMLPFEEHAIERAADVEIAGRNVKVCQPEDLILMKIISERDLDREDAREVARRQRSRLDEAYLEPRIRELASLLERPDLVTLWETWKSEPSETE